MKSNIFNELSKKLYLKDDIWFSRDSHDISYPDDGSENCYQVEDDSFWFRHRNNVIFQCLMKFPVTDTFFDIGGGNGYISLMLQNAGFDVYLIEPGIKGIFNAKKRGISNLVCSCIEDIDTLKGQIPAIGIFDVLEHIRDDISFLKNLKEFLSPDGKLFITVPAYQLLWSNEDEEAGHFRRYSLISLKKKLEELGFIIEYSTYFFSFLPAPIFFLRTFSFILGVKNKRKDIKEIRKSHNSNNKIVEKILSWELTQIRKSKKILFGSSCLFILKNQNENTI